MVTYLEDDLPVGTRQQYCCGVLDCGTESSGYWPNIAYFCPHCGSIWGREILTHSYDYQPRIPARWVVEGRPCRAHGDGQFLVGKPLDGCDGGLIRREFAVLMARIPPERPEDAAPRPAPILGNTNAAPMLI